MMVYWNIPISLLCRWAPCLLPPPACIRLPALRLSPLHRHGDVRVRPGGAIYHHQLDRPDAQPQCGMTVPPSISSALMHQSDVLLIFTGLVTALLFWFSWNIRRTRVGRAFMAVRDSPIAAQSMGVRLPRYKTISFGLSAFYGELVAARSLCRDLRLHQSGCLHVQRLDELHVTMYVVGGDRDAGWSADRRLCPDAAPGIASHIR